MLHRLGILIINLFFPPLAVLLLTGPASDTLLSCLLFLAGIIPSHVHGFYLSWVYFSRRRRVRKGLYPGPRPRFAFLIFDKRVVNGGLSDQAVEARRIKQAQEKGKRETEKREARHRRRRALGLQTG